MPREVSEVSMKNVHRKDKWILGNEEDAASPWALGPWWPAFLDDIKRRVGKPFPYFVVFEGWHMRWFTPESYAKRFAKSMLQRAVQDPRWLTSMYRRVVAASDRLYCFSERVRIFSWRTLDNKQLAATFVEHERLARDILGWGLPLAFLDVPQPCLTTYATELLERRARQRRLGRACVEYFSQLTTVAEANVQRREAVALRRIAERWPRLSAAQRRRVVAEHVEDFTAAYFGYTGPALKPATVTRELRRLSRNVPAVRAELREWQRVARRTEDRRRAAERELKLTAQERRFFAGIRDVLRSKVYRRDIMAYSTFVMQPALREFARRCRVSPALVQHLIPSEVGRLLAGEQRLARELPRRRRFFLIDGTAGSVRTLAGQPAQRFLARHYRPPAVGKVTELAGQTACPGKAMGIVRIVNVPADMKKMKMGDILVSIATTPDIVSAMRKATAIVTNEGGITSHAAIVSRELGKPCVIGTKIATHVFKDGDKVEVDANKGVVRKIK